MSPATKRLLTEALEELDGCGCQFWACEGIGPTAATAIEGTKGRRLPGLKQKDLIGIPWSVAFALRADGWYLRSDIIWHKPNPMPESVTDRPTSAHEHIFLLSKSERYFYDADAVKEPAIRPGDTQTFGGEKAL